MGRGGLVFGRDGGDPNGRAAETKVRPGDRG